VEWNPASGAETAQCSHLLTCNAPQHPSDMAEGGVVAKQTKFLDWGGLQAHSHYSNLVSHIAFRHSFSDWLVFDLSISPQSPSLSLMTFCAQCSVQGRLLDLNCKSRNA
jgi:hypothetical protein